MSQADSRCEECAGALRHKADETGDEVAGCDPGEDSEDAEMGVVKVRVEAEEEVESEDGGAAARRGCGGRGCGSLDSLLRARCGSREEDDGRADEEEEVGEDEVGEGEAVPGGVIELGKGVGPVAGVVDEDHEGDGDAAEDIDGEDASRTGQSRMTGSRCNRRRREGALH